MRITQQTIFDGFMKHINENRAEMHDLQQDIASGKKITKASDDPLKFKKARLLENQIREQPHHENVELAMIKSLHCVIKYKS